MSCFFFDIGCVIYFGFVNFFLMFKLLMILIVDNSLMLFFIVVCLVEFFLILILCIDFCELWLGNCWVVIRFCSDSLVFFFGEFVVLEVFFCRLDVVLLWIDFWVVWLGSCEVFVSFRLWFLVMILFFKFVLEI